MKDIKTAEEYWKDLQDGKIANPNFKPLDWIFEFAKAYAEYYHKAKIEAVLPKNDIHILANFLNHKRFDWNEQIFSVRIVKPIIDKLLNDL